MKFALVTARKAYANQSVESGRDYVEAYFDHGHFAGRLATFASVDSTPAHGEHAH